MASFAYRAYLDNGSSESGLVEAADRRDASRKLIQANKRPYALRPLASEEWPSSGQNGAWWLPRRALDKGKLLSELSVLLNAGFDPAAALRVLASTEASAPSRARLASVSDLISSGKPLAEAFASVPGFTPDMRAMIASGEASGRIAQVVARMAESETYRAERNAAVRNALVYPAFLLVMVLAAFLFLALFLMPAIEPIFDSGTVQKPFVVKLMSSLGTAIREDGPLLAGLLLAGLVFTGMLLRRPGGRAKLIEAAIKLPVFGRLQREFALVRFLDTLSLLAGNGVALLEALRLSAQTCAIGSMQVRLNGVRDSVANGERLQAALSETGLFDSPTLTLVGIGEESNNLALLLKRASTMTEARLKASIDRLVTFLTPAITIGLGLLIGSLVVSVMTALLSINQVAIQ